MSLVHLDWHTSDINGKQMCAVLDDSSRCVLAGGEFDEATADNAIGLMREAISKYGWLTDIREVLTDRGSQFYANKRVNMETQRANSNLSSKKLRSGILNHG